MSVANLDLYQNVIQEEDENDLDEEDQRLLQSTFQPIRERSESDQDIYSRVESLQRSQ